MMIVMAYVLIHHVLIHAWDSVSLLCEYKKYSDVLLKCINPYPANVENRVSS